jgi:hypothetical protein
VVALKKVPLHHPERMQQILSELRALQANMVSITKTNNTNASGSTADPIKQQAPRTGSPLPGLSLGLGRSPKHHRATSSAASVSSSIASSAASLAAGGGGGGGGSSSSPSAPSSYSAAADNQQQQQQQPSTARSRNTSLQRARGAEQGQGHSGSKLNLLAGINLPKIGSNSSNSSSNGGGNVSGAEAAGAGAGGGGGSGSNRASFGAGMKFSIDPRTRLPTISINTMAASGPSPPPSQQQQPQPQLAASPPQQQQQQQQQEQEQEASLPSSPVGSASPLGAALQGAEAEEALPGTQARAAATAAEEGACVYVCLVWHG